MRKKLISSSGKADFENKTLVWCAETDTKETSSDSVWGGSKRAWRKRQVTREKQEESFDRQKGKKIQSIKITWKRKIRERKVSSRLKRNEQHLSWRSHKNRDRSLVSLGTEQKNHTTGGQSRMRGFGWHRDALLGCITAEEQHESSCEHAIFSFKDERISWEIKSIWQFLKVKPCSDMLR